MNDYSIFKNYNAKQTEYIREAENRRTAQLVSSQDKQPGQKAYFMFLFLMIAL